MSEMKISGNAGFGESVLSSKWLAVLAGIVMATSTCLMASDLAVPPRQRTAIIFDTDICDDIDDTWALALILQSPEFDVKLITTAVGNTPSKAKTVAKFLETVGRTEIPVGIGIKQRDGAHRQDAWARDYKLSSYPGTVYQDGVQALIDTIMKSRGPIKLIATGPLPNVAAALEREPKIAEKAEFIGMHGSLRRGYGGNPKPSPEYNVRADVKAAQKVFTAPWKMTITPLDTCGIVQLQGGRYQKVLRKNSPLTRALIANYHAWYRQGLVDQDKTLMGAELNRRVNEKLQSSSTILFDTVAVYLALSTDLVKMEELGVRVTGDGYTRIDDNAKVINCAAEWKNLGAYEDFLVERLTK
jgi:inosine-uridine nucleoside N-ribohydrolase